MLHSSAFPESKIIASLSVVSLDHLLGHPPYEALSYVWGKIENGHKISLSGQAVTVTDNLFAALKELRRTNDFRVIWIDALCINQKNDPEKNSQVRLMEDIYTNCSLCWLWLGKSTNGTGTQNAIRVLENWASDRHLFSNANFNATYISLAAELTSRAWFLRTWTVQESILLQKLTAVSSVEGCRGLKLDIITCLNRYRNRDSNNAKDKIFGLRSLIAEEDRGLVDVEYKRKTEDTCRELCEQYIKKIGSLEILKYVIGDVESSKVGVALPSWVPDWTLKIAEPTWQQGRLDRYSLYNSCGSLRSKPEFNKVYDKHILRERGVRCDIVANVGEERRAPYPKEEKVQNNIVERIPGEQIPSGWSDSGLADLNREGRERKRSEFWSTILMDSVEGSDGNLRRAEEADYIEHRQVLEHVITGSAWPAAADRIYYTLETATLFRKFFVTADGHFGLGPATMENNDEIFVLRGGYCPLVLRSVGVNDNYKLIGDCFLYNFMDGEAMVDFESRSIIVSLE